MQEKKKIRLLQRKYNIPDKELIAIGLKSEDKTNESTKVSYQEKEKLHNICLNRDIAVSKYIRDSINDLIESSPEEKKRVAANIKKLEKNKKNRALETSVPYVLNISCKESLYKFCKDNNIRNKSSVARYIIIETIRKDEQIDILSK